MTNKKGLYSHIGRCIQHYRKEKGLTQAQLAKVLSLNRTSITNIEKGRQALLLHTLYDLAAALGVKYGNLLPTNSKKDSPGMKIPKELSNKDLSSTEIQWVTKIMGEKNA